MHKNSNKTGKSHSEMPLTFEGISSLNKKGGKVMSKEHKENNLRVTDEDIIEALLLISEASKTLALEVMLLPKDQSSKGGDENGEKSNDTQQEI